VEKVREVIVAHTLEQFPVRVILIPAAKEHAVMNRQLGQ
jgi:hypothetical protein